MSGPPETEAVVTSPWRITDRREQMMAGVPVAIIVAQPDLRPLLCRECYVTVAPDELLTKHNRHEIVSISGIDDPWIALLRLIDAGKTL